jgi:hypothetical protein
MQIEHWRNWLWQYVLPAVVLSFPVWIPGLFYTEAELDAGDADGVMLISYMVALPAIALLIGILIRPVHAWISPVVALLLSWVVIVGWGSSNGDVGPLFGMVFFIALPQVGLIWLGRMFGNWAEPTISRLLHRGTRAPG